MKELLADSRATCTAYYCANCCALRSASFHEAASLLSQCRANQVFRFSLAGGVIFFGFHLTARSRTSCAAFACRVEHRKSGTMRYIFVLLSFCAVLAGCAAAPAAERRSIAWDGLGQDPNRPAVTKRRMASRAAPVTDPNLERQKVLATMRPYSDAWWAVQDEIEAENDRQLGSKLVICRSCVTPPRGEETTGSIR